MAECTEHACMRLWALSPAPTAQKEGRHIYVLTGVNLVEQKKVDAFRRASGLGLAGWPGDSLSL
jgi:hypothetical protein